MSKPTHCECLFDDADNAVTPCKHHATLEADYAAALARAKAAEAALAAEKLVSARLRTSWREDCAELAAERESAVNERDAARTALAERDRQLAALKPSKCAANFYSDPPQDCVAPFCGCHPEWEKCIEMLIECGWQSPEEARAAPPDAGEAK